MEKTLNEIGKLRNEMKLGFIEVGNQMRSAHETLVNPTGRRFSAVILLP